ncbi:MAG: TIM barrel protein [Clostridiales bacterium]|nr:TIM barrel protein [Clostridiales bacterium]
MRFGFQLYGAAKECRSNPKDFFEKVHGMGYEFIEPCIVFGTDEDVSSSKMWNEQEAENFLAEAERVGLRAFSVHAFAENLQAELPSMERMGRQHQVSQFVIQCPFPVTKEVYSEFAENCVKIAEELEKWGIELLIHNGSKEIEEKIDGKTGYEWLLEQCGGKVGAQPDTGWIFYGGEDPEELLHKIEKYVRSLHHKDFCRTEEGWKEVAVGEGEVDTPACFKFGKNKDIPQFADMDGSENDMLENLETMVHYLSGLNECCADTAVV